MAQPTDLFPIPLTRQTTSQSMDTSTDYMNPEDPEERRLRYLQYDCNYRACKYKDPPKTWGEIIKLDYEHFVDLMCKHVPLDSKTFAVLENELQLPDQEIARKSTRLIDTEEEKRAQKERYLSLKCQHNGRMKNKTWGQIFLTDYNYFLWSVGNTMGRSTRTFNTFVECLKEEDKIYVLKTPKGKVKVPQKTSPPYSKTILAYVRAQAQPVGA